MEISSILNTYMLMNYRQIESLTLYGILQLCVLVFVFSKVQQESESIKEYMMSFVQERFMPEQSCIEFKAEEGDIPYMIREDIQSLFHYMFMNKLHKKGIKKIRYFKLRHTMIKDDEEDGFIYFPYLKEVKLEEDIYFYMDSQKVEIKETDEIEDKSKTKMVENFCISITSKYHDVDHIQDFLARCKKEYNEYVEKQEVLKIFVFRDEGRSSSERIFSSTKTFDNLFFDQKEVVIERLSDFQKGKEEYERIGMQYSLGILMHGEPGTGKTSCIKAIARYLKRNIILVNTSLLQTNQEFRSLFTQFDTKKSLFVFEEIDCDDKTNNPWLDRVLKQEHEKKMDLIFLRSSKHKAKKNNQSDSDDSDDDEDNGFGSISMGHDRDDKLSLNCILETLDGTIEYEGRICIFTTNYPDKIDKALLRPGRIDLNIEFKKMKAQDINKMYRVWFNESLPEDVLLHLEDHVFSQADIGNLFGRYKKDRSTLHQRLIQLENTNTNSI